MLHFIKRIFFSWFATKSTETKETPEYFAPEEIAKDGQLFLDKEDLVFFPHLNVYGAFKYNVVRDIFANNKAITVSDIHIALNSVYFSLNEHKHQHNKKLAYRHLDFLSKHTHNHSNSFIEHLYLFYQSKFPQEIPFDLTEKLINPLIFVNILEEYGFLAHMPEFNPLDATYQHERALEHINSFFENSFLLTELLTNFIIEGKTIPLQMQQFLDEIQSDQPLTDELIAQFFASMIFSGTHSTASFLSTYLHTLFSRYPNLLKLPLDIPALEQLEDEVLRLHMPVQWVFRTVREATTYNDISLKVGDTVLLFVGVANRDPTIFETPSAINFNHTANHLSFGIGPYACIGRFTTRRNAFNLVSCVSKEVDRYTLKNTHDTHTIHNAILQLPLIVTYRT